MRALTTTTFFYSLLVQPICFCSLKINFFIIAIIEASIGLSAHIALPSHLVYDIVRKAARIVAEKEAKRLEAEKLAAEKKATRGAENKEACVYPKALASSSTTKYF